MVCMYAIVNTFIEFMPVASNAITYKLNGYRTCIKP